MRWFILLSFLFSTQYEFAASYLKVLYVADHKENDLYLIRENPTEAWKPTSAAIEGFTYEPGYEYCILVEAQSLDSLKMEKYIFKELKSKAYTNAAHLSTTPGDTTKWLLYKMKRKDGTQTFSLTKAYLQFNFKDKTFNGESDCNTISGTIRTDSTNLKFENIGITQHPCGKHSIQPDLLKVLSQTTSFKMTKNLLYLYKDKFLLALFNRKK